MDNEISEIKEVTLMFMKHIRCDGDLYPFSYNELRRIDEIVNHWESEEDQDGEV